MASDRRAGVTRASITEARVMRGDTARIGSRVKHFGQRWTGGATATVVGFRDVGHASPDAEPDYLRASWIRVVVEPDEDTGASYGSEWDWDRTEVIDRGQ